jgi:MraZ protein
MLLCGIKWYIIVFEWEEVGIYKNMLIGEYTHSIDDKNRVSLPAKFRTEMGKKIVITPGLDSCLFIFTSKEWQKIEERLNQSSLLQADNRSFNRFMFGGAVDTEVDANGRILIPDFLKERAGLKSKVVIIGVSSRLEVWNEKTWVDYKKVVEKQADTLAEKLGQVGVL